MFLQPVRSLWLEQTGHYRGHYRTFEGQIGVYARYYQCYKNFDDWQEQGSPFPNLTPLSWELKTAMACPLSCGMKPDALFVF